MPPPPPSNNVSLLLKFPTTKSTRSFHLHYLHVPFVAYHVHFGLDCPYYRSPSSPFQSFVDSLILFPAPPPSPCHPLPSHARCLNLAVIHSVTMTEGKWKKVLLPSLGNRRKQHSSTNRLPASRTGTSRSSPIFTSKYYLLSPPLQSQTQSN